MMLPLLLALSAGAQRADCRADMKGCVLNRLFAPDAATSDYFTRMTMRFGDSDTQLVVLTHSNYPVRPGGSVELVSYSIAGMGNGNLSQLISGVVSRNPNVTDWEIADSLKVKITRSRVKQDVFDRLIKELKAIEISPLSVSRVAVDEYSEYEFWYETGQECLRYTIAGPFGDTPQDKLGKWMIKFRAAVPQLTKADSVLKP
jgi:hypothetical protein